MIVGTAGHIDHGKTALVRALTGIDPDRLPEEKKRGITIELGYAFMPVPGGQPIGFVDVPGHEKLVRTMVAGASGIDHALLLIAADDGVMPQTVEHATILSLLGLRRGAAVVTKIDRVDEATLARRETQARDLLRDAGLDGWEVLGVSAQRGEGLAELRSWLLQEAQRPTSAASAPAGFRMGLDRAFTLDGIGTVVTGSIAAGVVHIGDRLCLAHAPNTLLRVRSLHSHNQSTESAGAGQRCAVGLAGLERGAAERGDTLCDPTIALQTLRLDVHLRVAPTEASPLRSGTLVHVHVATQERMATVAVLGQSQIAPGQAALAQLVLKQPITAWHLERFVLRDAAAGRTVAGGSVLDPYAPTRYRQTEQRLAYLRTQHDTNEVARLQAALAHAPLGLNGAQWLRGAGLATWPSDEQSLDGAVISAEGEWVISREWLSHTEKALVAVLEDFHARLPEDAGPDLRRARRLTAPRMAEALWAQLIQRSAENGRVALRNGFVHLPDHGEHLRAADKVVAELALPRLLEGRFDPPWVRDIARNIRVPEIRVRQVLARLAQSGEAFQVVKDLYYHPAVVRELASLAQGISQREGEVTAAGFRDATGLGRKRSIQILEFFDRIGYLHRVGDSHLVRPGTLLFSPEEKAS